MTAGACWRSVCAPRPAKSTWSRQGADLLAIIEVKARPTLADAALALGARQRARLLAAAEIVLAEHPEWARAGMRFDLMVVDAAGTVRRIADAFRWEN